MATLARAGRIGETDVKDECERLQRFWTAGQADSTNDAMQILGSLLSIEQIENIDLFDRFQLAAVLQICRECRSMSEAGRRLFAVSRQARTSVNDSDRLKKYLARFELSWSEIHPGHE